jgi:hypothetical protein
MNLGELLERTARNRGPLDLSIISITIAFMMLLLSQILGVGSLIYKTNGIDKQVGFLWSPNWTITYVVLFPLYLCLFAVLTERREFVIRSFIQARIITAPDGTAVSPDQLAEKWRTVLKRISLPLWVILALVVIQTTTEWTSYCLLPLLKGELGRGAVDWSTLAIVQPNDVNKWNAIVFSAIAYLYMGFALFVYEAILVYIAAVAWFVSSIGDPAGDFRLVLRDAQLGKRLSDVALNMYSCAVLGLCAMFVMRLQSKYLQSDYTHVTELWFNDIRAFVHWLTHGGPVSFAPVFRTDDIPSEWTSLGGVMFTLLILFSVVYLLYDTFAKARDNYLDNIARPEWRAQMEIPYRAEEVAAIRSLPILESIFPNPLHLAIIIVGAVLSSLFIGFGSIGLATLLYGGLQFGILPAFRKGEGGHRRPESLSFSDQSPQPADPEKPAVQKQPAEAASPVRPIQVATVAGDASKPQGGQPDATALTSEQLRSPEYWLNRVEHERHLAPASDPVILMSFASEDQEWIDSLRAFLDPRIEQLRNPDGRSYQLWNFSDVKRGTTPGDEFPEVIAEKMWSCRAALVLLSKHYFRSDYCRQIELPFLMWRREHHSLLCVPLKLGALPLERVRLPEFKFPSRRVSLDDIIDDRQAAANFAESAYRELNLQQLKERGIESEIDDRFEGLSRRVIAHLKSQFAAIDDD